MMSVDISTRKLGRSLIEGSRCVSQRGGHDTQTGQTAEVYFKFYLVMAVARVTVAMIRLSVAVGPISLLIVRT